MPTENPLRLLVITSRPLTDGAGNSIVLLDIEEERRRMRAALQSARVAARVEYVPHATTGAVKTALRDAWDVAHFTGHGTADGRLLLENDFGEAHALAPSETAQLFGESTARLIVLSACHSEIIARALHAAGAPALIAIDARVPIEDRAATIFAEHFYGALAQGWKIRDAFRDAQQSVALDDVVGDAHPPLDDDGKPEAPWSQRFMLIGDGDIAFAVGMAGEPPARPEPRVVGNLRARNANFVGRAKEIVEIVGAFDKTPSRTPRVAIIGAGGLGKTELSKAVAWWYVERGKADAVLWASASRDEGEFVLRDLASLLSIAARAFGLPITEQSSFDEQKRVVREFFEQHRVIVLLDNWETLEGRARKELWDFVLGLPGSTRVIVTSRDTLPPKDARNYELDTLTIADGAQLFLNIACNAGYFDRNPKLSKEDAAILSAIVERLGGYPLAIEVVAGQTESRALGDIWSDLVQIPKNVLEGKDELTGEPRGVWTSLGFSYDVLPAPAQSLFRQMSVFLAPAVVEDVAAVTTADGRRTTAAGEGEGGITLTRETLDTLVRRSLVRMREGAYALLPIVREYALSKLAGAGQDVRELHTRVIYYYGQKNTPEGAVIASDHLFRLAQMGSRPAAEEFVKYVYRFYQDLVMRGYWVEARQKGLQLIAVAHALNDRKVGAQASLEVASIFQRTGEYERASELYQDAADLFKELGDRDGMASVYHNLAGIRLAQGAFDEFWRLSHESLKLRQELGDQIGIATSLLAMGTSEYHRGNYDKAEQLCQESLKIFQGQKSKSEQVTVLLQLGMIEKKRGNYYESENLYQQSLVLAKEFRNKSGIAQVLHELGEVEYLRGKPDKAMPLLHESLKLERELGEKHGMATTMGQLGEVYHAQGQLKDALGYFIRAFAIFEELHSPYRELTGKLIAEVRQEVGEERFGEWCQRIANE